MCARPGPRWGALYALLLGVVAAGVGSGAVPVPLRMVFGWTVGIVAATATFWWIRANRVALDQVEWCACASASVRMRVIAPMSSVVAPPSSELAAAAPVWLPLDIEDQDRVVTTGH